MKIKILSFILLYVVTFRIHAQDVTIPDSIFKAALVGNSLINTNADSAIQVSEASVFTGGIYVGGLGISDLTGIEAFTNLSVLNVNNNLLSALDVSNNLQLTQINCFNNQLDTLVLSIDTLLTYVECSYNHLKGIDVSGLPNLQTLNCYNNFLTGLDLGQNIQLSTLNCNSNSIQVLNLITNTNMLYLDCSFNVLNNLDLSALNNLILLSCNNNSLTSLLFSTANSSLSEIYCSNNQLTNFTLSGAINLYDLDCSHNQLSSLNLTSITQINYLTCSYNQITSLQLPAFYNLHCESNALTSLDFSNNNFLTELNCSNNNLSNLNIQNGNNSSLYIFDATLNPLLSCVQVDDTTFMQTNWSSAIDTVAYYSLSCTACIVNIPDTNFKTALLANLAINTNGNSDIECSEAAAYTGAINVSLLAISDLTGIEYFTALTVLNCDNNLLTNLDISANTQLIELNCSVNQLSSISINTNTLLETLYTAYNPISTLDLSANPNLLYLICNNSQLTNIDLSFSTNLLGLVCSSNQFSGIDISNNPNLTEINCDDNLLSSLDVSNNSQLSVLTCSYNQIDSLNISLNPLITNLNCKNNLLSYLNMQNGSNNLLSNFDATQNPSLTCIQVDDTNYMNTTWSNAKDASANYSINCGCLLPAAAGAITGLQQVGACIQQLGITYSVAPIANATNYVWNLPPLANIIGNPDSSSITVDYSAYSSSGNISVYGTNSCGVGAIASLPISFSQIPEVKICYATVDSATQSVEIFWQKPLETYVKGYVIYRETPPGSGTYLNIDTVDNTLFSSYLDVNSSPSIDTLSYKIASLDSCGNIGDISAASDHKTIFLSGTQGWGGTAKLYWNDYVGINDPNRYYYVLRDTTGAGPFDDTLAIRYPGSLNYTDITSSTFPNCRYVISMMADINCNPSLRTMLSKNTSHSNIKNRGALMPDVVQNAIKSEPIRMYPNPAKEQVNLVFNAILKNTLIKINDVLGQVVYTKLIEATNSSETILPISLQYLHAGMYVITIQNENLFQSLKLKVE
ncbi:MAG: leucine-rich repeat domain-containing protein [Bacteroidia bacterium]|nr:leucine-rich repeat domain-containing protein [Bacteroidia bacterium]